MLPNGEISDRLEGGEVLLLQVYQVKQISSILDLLEEGFGELQMQEILGRIFQMDFLVDQWVLLR